MTEEKKSAPKKTRRKPKKDEAAPAPKAEHKEERIASPAAPATEEKPATAEKSEPKASKPRKKKAPRKSTKVFVARGKRKESVARATIRPGNGTVRLNRLDVRSMPNRYVRDTITEALRYMGPEVNSIDILVNVQGGGTMGQAQAARTAIANALCGYFEDPKLRERFIDIDRSLVVEDTRRVESKKYRGPKARARFQKSYR